MYIIQMIDFSSLVGAFEYVQIVTIMFQKELLFWFPVEEPQS